MSSPESSRHRSDLPRGRGTRSRAARPSRGTAPLRVPLLDPSGVIDEDLVEMYRRGDHGAMEELLDRFRGFARVKVRTYFLAGADKEDVVQEGMIGLYKAIRDFDPEKETSFSAFAEVCITRQIITAVKTASRQKHGPLNSYVSLSKPITEEGGDDADRFLMDLMRAPAIADPAEVLVAEENLRGIKLAFSEILSEYETEVLHLYVEGKSYQDIAERLGSRVKSIDNALQRIKRKLELHLETRDGEDELAARRSSRNRASA